MVDHGARVVELVYEAIDEVNSGQPDTELLTKSVETTLVGDSSTVDSLALVTLIIALETRVQDDLGVAISLVDDRAMSRERSPFQTVGTLVDYVVTLLEEQAGE